MVRKFCCGMNSKFHCDATNISRKYIKQQAIGKSKQKTLALRRER